jgi:hypothetical protein
MSTNLFYTKTNYSIFIKVKKRVLLNMEIGYARVSTQEQKVRQDNWKVLQKRCGCIRVEELDCMHWMNF